MSRVLIKFFNFYSNLLLLWLLGVSSKQVRLCRLCILAYQN